MNKPMKASALIAQIERLIDQHGDCILTTADSVEECDFPVSAARLGNGTTVFVVPSALRIP